MSARIGSYTFLPWLRQGLAKQISGVDAASGRATIEIRLRVEGERLDGTTLPAEPVPPRPVALYGPGDVVGIDRRAIVRTEPRDWITNFEANYLPYVEFYDEDFPWRYTPEPASGHRLRPWIALVVLTEDEFSEGARRREPPLPSIAVDAPRDSFPPFDQLWAWAHVHVNRDLGAREEEIVSRDMAAVLPALEAATGRDRDIAYSRLLSPRRLEANTTYHAFLVPAYEAGRRAGLGLDPAGVPAGLGAWEASDGRPEPGSFPYYHRWRFMTGPVGDFAHLVRLLEPRPIDSRVGRRDVDVRLPGWNVRGVETLGGVLRLGGALRVPLAALDADERAELERYEGWDRPGYPQPFQDDLAAFVNLADDYARRPAAEANRGKPFAELAEGRDPRATEPDPDPLVTPPLYGRWHALTSRLLTERDGSRASPDDNWVHQLNLDPRHRAAANFGTEVVQRNQERYMQAAWEQVGAVLEANGRIRRGQLAMLASSSWYLRTLLPLARNPARRERALALAAPVQARVMLDGLTVRQRIAGSAVPRALLSTEARRILRPGGRLAATLPFDETRTPANLIERVNTGEVAADPGKAPLEGAPTLTDVADAAEEQRAPASGWLPVRGRWLLLAAALLLLLLVAAAIVFGPAAALAALLVAAVLVLVAWLHRRLGRHAPLVAVREDDKTPEAVADLPRSPDFRLLTGASDDFRPSHGPADSAEAERFKAALRDAYRLVAASRAAAVPLRPPRAPLDLARVVDTLVAALDPRVAIPRHVYGGLEIPPRIRHRLGERFVEVMAYPEIDVPMYRPLVEAGEESFLPNLGYIGQNTVSLLEPNRAFIEAYMVGLNHELARELLWREYPTDLRGSYFRQFWDPSGYLDEAGRPPAQLRELLRDIPPLDRWPRASKLGGHDHRRASGAAGELVLVVRGELLKRYPTAVIYAHRARWQEAGGMLQRVLDDPGVAADANPPRSTVRTPLYEARVEPDIVFLGFDLTVEEAVGDPEGTDRERAGWFFVIKERPGEPRFGLGVERGEAVHLWSDLAWDDVAPGLRPGQPLPVGPATRTIALAPPPPSVPADDPRRDQASDDRHVRWDPGMDAADLAYLLYQVPVMLAVHSEEMLARREGG
jgi:hypothetical protein